LAATLWHAQRQLRSSRPDLLLTYNWGAIEWALANRLSRRIPHLHLEDGFGPDEANGVQLRRRIWGRRLALGSDTRIVVPSETLRAIAQSRWKFAGQRISYIPNGIDVRRYAPAGPAEAAERAPPVIGTVGALRPEKNIGRLLRAFAIVMQQVPVRLVVAGDGPDRPRLQELAVKLRVDHAVSFLGHQPNPDRLLPHLDLFALSSDTEQMPYSILEAMACGLPIAATDVGDVARMVVRENRPFIVPPGDDASLAKAMLALIRDPAARRSIGGANRLCAVERFDERAMNSRHVSLWREAITSGSPGGGSALSASGTRPSALAEKP
jgi:glycosyltransferase involved in cell wall biosynthesis